jgi:limonene-1,2-epoxide hydrolase
MEMSDPIETVKAFLAALDSGIEGGEAALRKYFTPETTWEMVGVGTMIGPEGAIKVMHDEYPSRGAATLKIDILSIAASGNTVLTERVDRLLTADGTEIHSARMMAAFEVSGGKILATREYFDTARVYGVPEEASH